MIGGFVMRWFFKLLLSTVWFLSHYFRKHCSDFFFFFSNTTQDFLRDITKLVLDRIHGRINHPKNWQLQFKVFSSIELDPESMRMNFLFCRSVQDYGTKISTVQLFSTTTTKCFAVLLFLRRIFTVSLRMILLSWRENWMNNLNWACFSHTESRKRSSEI